MLENAKKACDAAGPDYSVYNSKGSKVYPESVIEPVKPEPTPVEPAPAPKLPYLVKITASVLNVRSGPGMNYKTRTQVRKNEVYTIVEENENWGKLKSGAGWICLDYTKKV
jgi:SH3-like domain-containing protein